MPEKSGPVLGAGGVPFVTPVGFANGPQRRAFRRGFADGPRGTGLRFGWPAGLLNE
jgi:hypothetical protein